MASVDESALDFGTKRGRTRLSGCHQQEQQRPRRPNLIDNPVGTGGSSTIQYQQCRQQQQRRRCRGRGQRRRWVVQTKVTGMLLLVLSSSSSLSAMSPMSRHHTIGFPTMLPISGYPLTQQQQRIKDHNDLVATRRYNYSHSKIEKLHSHRRSVFDVNATPSCISSRRSIKRTKNIPFIVPLSPPSQQRYFDAKYTTAMNMVNPHSHCKCLYESLIASHFDTQLSATSSSPSSSSDPSGSDLSSSNHSKEGDNDDKFTDVSEPIPPLEVVGSPQPPSSRPGQEVSTDSSKSISNNNGLVSMSSVEKLDRRLARLESKYVTRISRLEEIVSRQEVELHKLRKTCSELREVSTAFAELLNILRDSPSLNTDNIKNSSTSSKQSSSSSQSSSDTSSSGRTSTMPSSQSSSSSSKRSSSESQQSSKNNSKIVESFDDAMIFGRAPSSVIDAADAAGTAILAGMLGGKQRMLVDVRDAELSSDPETLVQFIELAILPVAAGLEGLKSTRNRVKIVFPKVSQLLEYRRTMALAAPEVVALSTLDFDPIEERDKLVVIVAPEPDDDEGIEALKKLLAPAGSSGMIIEKPVQQPVVLLNYHMHPPPVSGLDDFETAYHLRLLAVQYMSASAAEQFMEQLQVDSAEQEASLKDISNGSEGKSGRDSSTFESDEGDTQNVECEDDELESAVKHAHDVGMNQGTTRAMVIRAYPRPWHVFVDVSPDTDADFEVAATFDEEPTSEELNMAIVECLEGSEMEDELVAQQMQQALEEGQLDNVSQMISQVLNEYGDDDNDDDDDDDFYIIEEDSV